MSSRIRWIAGWLAIAAFAGCSKAPEVAEVHGRITLDGAPVAGAHVDFVPESGRPAEADTDKDGNYVLVYSKSQRGALHGPHQVRISTYVPGKRRETIPSEYNTNSTLTFDVQPNTVNTANFELKSGSKVIQPPR